MYIVPFQAFKISYFSKESFFSNILYFEKLSKSKNPTIIMVTLAITRSLQDKIMILLLKYLKF